uniref:Putative ovule protein n=1 Tax=Solanum chacoense TaxID=4108 RepID=A0A0V0GZD7_SOLCH
MASVSWSFIMRLHILKMFDQVKTSTLNNSHWLSGSPGILRFQPPELALRSPLFLLFLGKWISEAKHDFNVD